ncbi:Lon protease family protein [Caldisalinibacter kiritimatiensis]|uniref:endopeptidase La n=1 Tax=Caldisalinibacter kiritimatiensis TaxID=1304284 RepID=R1ASC1_9FIRM|nr:ATP-binding protein [Caldisalinibacter kiritimatiensis]EOC99546.1 ATP-dependent protease La Type II [Caldisalinibacter kiritimatiensis]
MRKDLKIPFDKLKKKCNIEILNFNTTAQLSMSREIIGQERAMKALRFGLSVKRKGYNIFVSGVTGTGRNSYTYSVAKEFAREKHAPDDLCYVYNFEKPENPKLISLNSGKGIVFKKKIEYMVRKIKRDLPKAFTSKEYENKKNLIYSQYDKKIKEIIENLNEIAKEYGFMFKENDGNLVSIPLVNGHPMTEKEIIDLTEEEISEIKENSNKLSRETFDYFKKIRQLEEQSRNRIKQLKEEIALKVVDTHVMPIIDEFEDNKQIKKYLYEVEDDIIKNINEFLDNEKTDQAKLLLTKGKISKDFFKRYEVNLFIDNSDKKGAPVIKETNPDYYNLLGQIEYVNELGVNKTDHTRIKPGAIHLANGGYLIIQAKDILTSPYAWHGLKRALNTGKAKIENIGKGQGNMIVESIKPEPIPIDLKVMIIGDYHTYQLLYNYDNDFKKLFRIRADFDIEMERNKQNINKLASFIACHCKDEKLKAFDKSAVGKIVEFSSRLAEDKRKLTARFNEIVEILYEADAWADFKGDSIVTEEHVKKAIQEKVYRNNKYEQKLHELFKDETILIQTSGYEVGQINGLAVINTGQYTFGKPNKITVSTFVGKDGIINIEREVKQSGKLHDKGVLILSGYLGEKYANNKPLSLSASITFEQSYSVIDGDSASSTELYALISSLAEVPINQAIAVTGSVNQKGVIQPIGGVNEKIEGYFKVCKEKGFSGGEGVMIPHQNMNNLMLNDEVIEAVKEGKFSIYVVKTIDEGIEILTGMPAGIKDRYGNYPKGTINNLVQKKLNSFARIYKDFN